MQVQHHVALIRRLYEGHFCTSQSICRVMSELLSMVRTQLAQHTVCEGTWCNLSAMSVPGGVLYVRFRPRF